VKIEGNDIYIRQSWLGDALICMERGRLTITQPNWRVGSDSTVLGTACHSGIEHYIDNGGDVSLNDMREAMVQSIRTNEETFKWTAMKDEDDMIRYGDAMLGAWWRDIRPDVALGGLVEHNFTVAVTKFIVDNTEYALHYTGTMDYIAPDGTIWDWKTANRKYFQGEKQRQSIQASVYSTAAVSLGLVPAFPVSFKFGVMLRKDKSEGQIVEVRRTEAHSSWLETQTKNIVSSALRLGQDNPWLQVDQHNLCSEQWCPWWSICKGAHLGEHENRWNPADER
jgi:hypothetical protein